MGMQFKLHHIGYLVKDLSEASVFKDRLGYLVESEIIEDPVQTAHVLLMRQPGSASQIELVMPAGPKSKLSRALAKGGGLHHFCYEVDDICAAGAHLREKGMLALSEPAEAVAFKGRRIAWYMDSGALLIELLESGPKRESA